MSSLSRTSLLALCIIWFTSNIVSVVADESTLVEDCTSYFMEIDNLFLKIVDAGALRSTNLKQAERFFIREMRKNRAFFTFIRTNSKGTIISEIVRGEKVERPMLNVQDERWFKFTMEKKEPYYTLKKDEDRGRYYLYWARPILKQGDRCVGAVLLKIDLWDSFYEFSNSMYIPFLIKLGNKSLFSHKWNNNKNATEELLSIPGIAKITITFNAAKKTVTTPVVAPQDTLPPTSEAVIDSPQTQQPEAIPAQKKLSGIYIISLVAAAVVIIIISVMLISWMRKRALLRQIDEDDLL